MERYYFLKELFEKMGIEEAKLELDKYPEELREEYEKKILDKKYGCPKDEKL